MAKQKLKDSEAKAILLQWPQRTKTLWSTQTPSEHWMRAQPAAASGAARSPRLSLPGARLFHTQPDGMWLRLDASLRFADVVCIECCGTIQNLNDKRSRYAPSTHGLVVLVKESWLTESITVQHGSKMSRWRATGSITSAPTTDCVATVRHLRVLYALPNILYSGWVTQGVLGAHEFMCRHSSLDGYNSQTMQRFLKRMSPSMHLYTTN